MGPHWLEELDRRELTKCVQQGHILPLFSLGEEDNHSPAAPYILQAEGQLCCFQPVSFTCFLPIGGPGVVVKDVAIANDEIKNPVWAELSG